MEDLHYSQASSLLTTSLDSILQILSKESDWELIGNEEGVQGYILPQSNGLHIVKATGVINKSVEEIKNFIWDFTNRRITDESLKEIRMIKSFENHFRIMYEQLDAPWPVSNRDFVYAQKALERSDGFLIYSKSFDCGVSEIDGVVRGEVIYRGTYLQRISETNTKLTGIGCIDPKGAIPNSLVNLLGRKQISKFIKLRKTVEAR